MLRVLKLFSLRQIELIDAAETDDSGPVVIPDRLPPLVSFELDKLPSFSERVESRLTLPSLCTQVGASLKMLSLTGMRCTSFELQYIGEHLPLLEVLQFRCVLYIAFAVTQLRSGSLLYTICVIKLCEELVAEISLTIVTARRRSHSASKTEMPLFYYYFS